MAQTNKKREADIPSASLKAYYQILSYTLPECPLPYSLRLHRISPPHQLLAFPARHYNLGTLYRFLPTREKPSQPQSMSHTVGTLPHNIPHSSLASLVDRASCISD